MTLDGLYRWQRQITSRNGRSVISLARKTLMEYRTIGYNGVSRWCPNLKWGRPGHWWLDSRRDSEHNVSRRVEEDEAESKAGKQAAAGVCATGQTQEKK